MGVFKNEEFEQEPFSHSNQDSITVETLKTLLAAQQEEWEIEGARNLYLNYQASNHKKIKTT